MRGGSVLALAALVALTACGDDDAEEIAPTATQPEQLPVAGDATRGLALIRSHECNRCHDGAGTGRAAADQHCVGCHEDIRAGRFDAPPEALARWRESLTSLNAVPSLTGAGARLRREWIAAFLLSPHDQRPRLPATMPRLALGETEALDIATHLVPTPSVAVPPPPDARTLEAGRRLLDAKGCGACHAFGGVPPLRVTEIPVALSPEALERAMILAPDLRYTRDRFQPAALVAWLRNPAALKPDTAMPAIPLTDGEAEQIAGYLLAAELAPLARVAIAERLPVLDRPVRYDEVYTRVLRKTCRHCHADPDLALGDGGPGNTGGFGFAPRRLVLASYAGVASGYVGDDGERRSVFEADARGVPRLVASLLARHAEEAGQPVAGIRGMPLGLPPLPLEDIQLVETWIAQGRPR